MFNDKQEISGKRGSVWRGTGSWRKGTRATLLLLGLVGMFTTPRAAEVIDSGVELGEYPVILWMDEDRVMFSAASGEFCDRGNGSRQPLNRLAIFDIKTRKLTWYGELGVSGLCYAGGNIAYSRRAITNGMCPKIEWRYFRGRFGEEKEGPEQGVDPYTCLPIEGGNFKPEWIVEAEKAGRRFKPLKAEHGWLEFSYCCESSVLKNLYLHRIYPPGDENGLAINGPRVERLNPFLRYYSFKGAYLIFQGVFAIPTLSGEVQSWWLYPDGRIEQALHYDRALRKGDPRWDDEKFIPTHQGFLLTYSRSYSRALFSNSKTGLHLFRADGNFKKIADGVVSERIEVSPNGCRVALGMDDSYSQERTKLVIKIIDICKE